MTSTIDEEHMKAVILAGGLGKRLEPLTKTVPKPLLPVGEKSILDIQIGNLAKYGFKTIYIATYYKADFVESIIGSSKKHGVDIVFSKEPKPLGTCGPLSVLREELDTPFVLMNGDILTNLDFNQLIRYGNNQDADLTVVTKTVQTPFNFGHVVSRDNYIVDIEEKPNIELEILAGIYFMRPGIMKLIPENTYFGIDSLIKKMLEESLPVARYHMTEYWLDIGSPETYDEAQIAYEIHFK